ncbi:RsmB/NOP family class I SAM-dependent RNA methyltransferase [Actinocatenispora rupis]|uniref:Putative Fmu protein (SUN protein) n=1 Tax=Actinocatenispora rupis TaxID=519421 RepID=A0A8J3NAX1_9ACTN|nr:transcription antitermination factor NusB [Actinocatenispora rupis]GID12531.1 putative Fmu protein (SUN protein) [Actinocatenispora rupis]
MSGPDRGRGRNREGRPARRGTPRRPAPLRPVAGAKPVDRARRAAFEVLRQVHDRGAYANLALPALLGEWSLSGRDAAFATELCYGTLRATGTLDAVLAAGSNRPLSKVDGPVRDALRLGAYQLLYTRVPAHAAVSTTVALARSASGAGSASFANAVLRRVSTSDLPGWLERLAPTDDAAGLAVRYAHPEWIVRALGDALGGDEGDLTAALTADNERPAVHLAARPGRTTAAELAERVGGTVGRLSPYAVYLPGGAPGDLAEIRDGRAQVQDEGSQLVTLALADAPLDGPDVRWLDLCAGPGGKAALLGSLAAQRGARLTAVEVTEHRATLVGKAVAGLPVDVLHADGRTVGERPELPAGGFDRVLLDAPCTGLGALRRRPEARWRRQESDLDDLVALQRELLAAACRAVRPGGLIGYVTCSPHPAETTAQIAALLADQPGLTQLDARAALDAVTPEAVQGLGEGPAVQLWPHRHGTDAMFLALLRRDAGE